MLLFGSRARGDYRQNSDYDILIIVPDELDLKERRKIAATIRRGLAEINIEGFFGSFDFTDLTEMAVDSRYPGDLTPPSIDDCKKYSSLATEIKDAAIRVLATEPD